MLYHYTDFMAFDGILGNTELRLNNVLNMNDASEMRFYMDGLCKAVLKKLRKNKMGKKASVIEHFFTNELKEEFNYSAYAACFSRYCDDASQWERYGKDGRGVCISFDENMLRKITDITDGCVSLQNVQYDQDFSSLDMTERFYRMIAENDSLSDYLDDFQALMLEAWSASAAFKHPSFANENEVRMVVTPRASELFTVMPKYYISLGRIKKYYPMNLKDMCSMAGITMDDLVKEVTIGPTSTQSKAILKDYLRDKGYQQLADHVNFSNCPLRMPNL